MKLVGLLFFAVLAAAEVVVLTDDNFDNFVTDGSSWMLEFYAPWCNHCQKLAPVYEEASDKYEGKLYFGKIDCTVNTALAKRFSVKGYPTIKFYRDGEYRDFRNQRNLQGFVSFADTVVAPAVMRDISFDQIESLRESRGDMVTFLLYTPAGSNSKQPEKLFSTVARTYQGLSFFASTENSVLAERLMQGKELKQATIIAINDDPYKSYETFIFDTNIRVLKAWIVEHRFPLMSEMGSNNYEDMIKSGKKTVVAAVDFTRHSTHAFMEHMRELAKATPMYKFGALDFNKWNTYLENFYVKKDHLPAVFVFDSVEETFWLDDPIGPFTTDRLEPFLQLVSEGKIKTLGKTPWTVSYWVKALNAKMEDLTDTELLFYVVIFALLLLALIVFACFKMSDEEQKLNNRVELRKEEKEKASKEKLEDKKDK